MQNSPIRKNSRFLSSLLDLKLVNQCSKKQINQQESKRKLLKYCPIKINANSTQIYQNFIPIQKKKSLIDKNLITKSLSSHFIFSSLINDKLMFQLLIQKFKFCRVDKENYLLKQNDNASSFFILHQGELQVQIDGKLKRKIKSGQGFGQLALIYSSPRSASIKANKASFLWYIDRTTFRKALSSLIEKNFKQTRKFIQQTPFFIYLTESQKQKVASIAITQKFNKGSSICKKGQLASSMYILKQGVLKKITDNSEEKIQMGSYFGEYTMLQKNSKWKQTIITEQDSQVIALGVEDIQNAFGRSLPLIIIRNKARQCLNNSLQFAKLSKHYIDLALDCFKIKNVSADQKIIPDSTIFLVLQGQYQISKQNQKKNLANSNLKVLYGSINQKSTITQIKFKTNGKVAWTTPKEILSAFRGTYEQTVQKCKVIQNTAIKQRDYIAELKKQCQKYKVNDFKVLTKLGEGQFGTVYLVTDPNKDKKRLYALKCIPKYQTVKNKLQKHLMNEKIVMQQMTYSTPFCVNFIRSFKDQSFVYFLMEYINGLQLFDVIRLIGILTPEQSKFYGAIMLDFLQKMHSKNIIYRDLKPENIIVSQDGYLKMIDMGTCKKMQTQSKNPKQNSSFCTKKTFTIIGTPNYMAPQIISGKGYSFAVDLWSLGIVIYQFMAGYVPFGEQAQDPYQIYQQIIKNSLIFPHYMKDQSANSFITQLLSKLPQARLGGSYSSLKRHSFLSSIEWSTLLDKKLKTAFQIPKNKLINVQKLIDKSKSLQSYLPNSREKPCMRKDLDNKWDDFF